MIKNEHVKFLITVISFTNKILTFHEKLYDCTVKLTYV